MSEFSDILLVSDFDRTLTNRENQIPQRNLDALRDFTARGGRFTVASGRSVPLFRPKAELLSLQSPCILANGAICYDFRTETLLHYAPLPEALASGLLEAIRAYDGSLCLEIQRLDGHYLYRSDGRRDAFLRASGVTPIHTDCLPPFPWGKLAVCGAREKFFGRSSEVPPEELAAFGRLVEYVETLCGGQCQVTRSMPCLLEISAAGWNKGRAARALAERLGRRVLVCVGDAPNDLSMLQEADLAFAPADCDPSVAPFCRRTVPCGEGSVAAVIAALAAM